jgi:serine/threonine-protein kinase
MREEIRADPLERRRFIQEARTVAGLHHPNIVDIYSIVEEGPDVYLVFEFVAGATLYEVLDRRGRLPLKEAAKTMSGVCAALEYAHKRDVIHRDLKPSNIMVTDAGVVKVMDFGVARQAKDAVSKLSMTNTIVGTPPYMAPEQEQGVVQKESDLYAMAVCLYELVTGRLPFQGMGAGMLLNKMNKSFVPPSTLAPELPAAFDTMMSRALDPDPTKRFRTVKEFNAALDQAAASAA